MKRELNLGRISRYDLYKDRDGNVWAIDKQGKEEPVWAGTVEDLSRG